MYPSPPDCRIRKAGKGNKRECSDHQEDARCAAPTKQRLRRIHHTTQGDATAGNKAGGIVW